MNKTQLIKYIESDEGEGIIDIIKNTASVIKNGVRKGPSPKFREMLKKYGAQVILKMTVQRKPVAKAIKLITDVLTLGQFTETAKKLGYDDIFHLSVILQLENGPILSLEKNEVAVLSVVKSIEGQQLEVKINDKITLSDFVNRTVDKIGINNYYLYNASSLNCQKFILDHLDANKLKSAQLTKFIMQDANRLLQDNKLIISAFKKITDLGAITNKIIEGEGFSDFIKDLFDKLSVNKTYEDSEIKESWTKNKKANMNAKNIIDFLK